jgi:hypothetical protein
VLEMAGRRVGFLGGAQSIDGDVRTVGLNYWPDIEEVTWDQARLGNVLVLGDLDCDVIDRTAPSPRTEPEGQKS